MERVKEEMIVAKVRPLNIIYKNLVYHILRVYALHMLLIHRKKESFSFMKEGKEPERIQNGFNEQVPGSCEHQYVFRGERGKE